ncbi:hypothetical protein [Avibacterium sp. 21-599]|uniref:hypothetical protein n=1 Tax=Avibacterium sp. 21-599 TaxID=2911528 RepID=UPI002247075B|nr:hypothetical protein [Avibacterium sp. 21-599]MCW9717577.1 hypothetical protein [Avibacterium sp. 21-599]
MLLKNHLKVFNYIVTVFISLTTHKVYKRSEFIEGFRLAFLLCSVMILFSLLYMKIGSFTPDFIDKFKYISANGKVFIFIVSIIFLVIFYFFYLYVKELQKVDLFPVSFLSLSIGGLGFIYIKLLQMILKRD